MLLHNLVVQKKIGREDSKKEQGSCLKRGLLGVVCCVVVRKSGLLCVARWSAKVDRKNINPIYHHKLLKLCMSV